MKIVTTNSNEKINNLRFRIKTLNFYFKYFNAAYRFTTDVLLNEKSEVVIEFEDSMELDNFIDALVNFRNNSRTLCGGWGPQKGEKYEY